MWSEMKLSQINVVSNEQVSNECGLKWTWSQMNGHYTRGSPIHISIRVLYFSLILSTVPSIVKRKVAVFLTYYFWSVILLLRVEE